jgi:nucleoside-specific outer membrane channel protein Tsx
MSQRCPSPKWLCLSAFLGCCGSPAAAFEWSSTDLQLLYGDGFKLGDAQRATVTFEHADGWAYGDNFLFIDLINHLDHGGVEVEAYGELYSRLSFKKLFGWTPGLPGVKDVLPSFGFNAGSRPTDSPFRAYLGGLGIDFDVPGFDYLQLGLFGYQAEGVKGAGLQVTPVWSLPFAAFGLDFKFRGFFDYATGGANATGHWHFLAQPQVVLDVGALFGKKDRFMAGIEWWVWLNKYGLKGQNDSVPQACLLYFF